MSSLHTLCWHLWVMCGPTALRRLAFQLNPHPVFKGKGLDATLCGKHRGLCMPQASTKIIEYFLKQRLETGIALHAGSPGPTPSCQRNKTASALARRAWRSLTSGVRCKRRGETRPRRKMKASRGSHRPRRPQHPTTSAPWRASIGTAARADERRLMLKYNPARFVQASCRTSSTPEHP